MAVTRSARLEDVGQCCRLLEILFSQEHEFFPDSALQARGIAMIIDNPDRGMVILCEEAGKAIGMVVLLFTVSTALGSRVAILEDMVVDPGFRGQGIGTLLMQEVFDYAEREGLGRITLLTDHDNTAAHDFYTGSGFTKSDMVVFRKRFPS
jgi:GNAT superfamily N-acetyltransferase